MKMVFFILTAFCLCAGLSAQKREGNVITVQGHHHEVLTRQAAQGKGVPQVIQSPQATSGSVYNIIPDSVHCTVGCTTVDPAVINPDSVIISTAYLMLKWTDTKARTRGDSILIWKYQWVSRYFNTTYNYWIDVSKTSIDMIRAVANSDARFSALLQNTGGGNFTAGGFGYNFGDSARVGLRFDLTAAMLDTINIKFRYAVSPNCLAPYNQFALPTSPVPNTLVSQATTASNNTGIIKHPFDAAYSYPAYDYDYWVLTAPSNNNHQWQAGWYKNYWAFYTGNISSAPQINYQYAPTGIATQPLSNNDVHYFIFASTNYTIPITIDGSYSNPKCSRPYCVNCGQ
jgi:hypothetical protein